MSPREGRAKARPFSRLLLCLLALGAGACKSPLDKNEASAERKPELGEPATKLPAGEEAAAAPTTTSAPAGGAPSTTAPAKSTAPTTPNSVPITTAPVGAPTTRRGEQQLAAVDDPGGTSGGAPSYADVRTITFIDADDKLRVVVDVAAPFPAFKTREVLGIGVDLFRTNAQESDYQLFADGGTNGWRAYLQTPDGFVAYPGTFAVGSTRLQFEVPWSSIGGRKSFTTSAFADWSSRDTLLPASGNDYVPDRGTASVDVR